MRASGLLTDNHSFWRNHLYAPLTAFLLLAGLFEYSGIDLMFADWLYRLEGGRWALRHDFLFSGILHQGAARLMKILALLILVLAAASHRIAKLGPYRRALWCLALSMPASALLVNIGKGLTHVDCPWDLLRYGGGQPYLGLFEPHSGEGGDGQCFPAGHASGGYALVALYFFFLQTNPERRFHGLGIGLACGLLFGFTQQLRGAHFLSHDLWTLAICWFNSLAWHQAIFKKRSNGGYPAGLKRAAAYRRSDYG
ncbi:MAG TPA: phosphatase PAP2 family protein [Sedimenticola sp.]|nr:phosphatase PAP2 family protein [Sedimenticola sp.]